MPLNRRCLGRRQALARSIDEDGGSVSMAGRARKDYFDPDEVGVYHCYNRCVRKAFLCGQDHETGEDHSHRKDWVRQRLELLASVFAIDVATHSAMDNHLHVVLRNRPDVVALWTDEMVARRWLRLDAKQLGLREVDEKQLEAALRDPQRIAQWRRNLSHISEFMRMLDEPIAKPNGDRHHRRRMSA